MKEARAVGSIKFKKCKEYNNKKHFDKDYKNHYVDLKSQFKWQKGKRKFGWCIQSVHKFKRQYQIKKRCGTQFARNVELVIPRQW